MSVSHRSHTSSEKRHTHVNTVPACSGTATPPSESETPASGILHSHLWIHEPPVRREDDIFRSFTLTNLFRLMINVSLYMTQLLTPSQMTCLEVTMLSLLGAAHDGTAGTFTLSKRIAKRECLQFMCTCNTKSIWTMEGGTRARGLDRASSSFTLRVMVFRKCSRASWRTDGSFPLTWTCTQIHTPLLCLISYFAVWLDCTWTGWKMAWSILRTSQKKKSHVSAKESNNFWPIFSKTRNRLCCLSTEWNAV